MKKIWDAIELVLVLGIVITVLVLFFRAMYLISASAGVFFRPFQF
jgi:hypothetical protein